MVTASKKPLGDDPRKRLGSDELEAASVAAYPQVARGASSLDFGLLAMFAGALAIGAVTWFSLFSDWEQPPPAPEPVVVTQVPTSPVENTMPAPQSIEPEVQPAPAVPAAAVPGEGELRAPAMIIDNSEAGTSTSTAKAAEGGPNSPNSELLNSNDQFAARLAAGNGNKATRISNPSETLLQGAIIPAVLETSLNSDLPGYARALVSRDVKSFDGTKILIPRGSRLVGEYKSGLTSGVTRAFVIWSCLIRPDGVSVQLSSPATDQLGQAGLPGDVNTHFAKRFGSAILLSAIGGLSNIGSSSSIVIGTSTGSQSVAAEALSADVKIPPTIEVAQGTVIQVFVVRDLDFGE